MRRDVVLAAWVFHGGEVVRAVDDRAVEGNQLFARLLARAREAHVVHARLDQVFTLLHFTEGVVGADRVITERHFELTRAFFDACQPLEVVGHGEHETALFRGAGGQAVAHQVLLELTEEARADIEHFFDGLRLHGEEKHFLDVLLRARHVLAAAHHVERDVREVKGLGLLGREHFPSLEAAGLE